MRGWVIVGAALATVVIAAAQHTRAQPPAASLPAPQPSARTEAPVVAPPPARAARPPVPAPRVTTDDVDALLAQVSAADPARSAEAALAIHEIGVRTSNDGLTRLAETVCTRLLDAPDGQRDPAVVAALEKIRGHTSR